MQQVKWGRRRRTVPFDIHSNNGRKVGRGKNHHQYASSGRSADEWNPVQTDNHQHRQETPGEWSIETRRIDDHVRSPQGRWQSDGCHSTAGRLRYGRGGRTVDDGSCMDKDVGRGQKKLSDGCHGPKTDEMLGGYQGQAEETVWMDVTGTRVSDALRW
jgi:hypothetical protein